MLEKIDIFGHAIKVNYKGEDAYKTKLGGFCTLIVYALSIYNFVTLLIAFTDNTRMESSVQKNNYSPFDTDDFSLTDYQTEITLQKPQIPSNIGRIRFFQNRNCLVKYGEPIKSCESTGKLKEIKPGTCSDVFHKYIQDYTIPRFGLEVYESNILPSIICFDMNELLIGSEEF